MRVVRFLGSFLLVGFLRVLWWRFCNYVKEMGVSLSR